MDRLKLPMLLDGATGVRLINAGMPPGACPEAWITDNPDVLREIQRGYVQAGSDAVYAPTFGANRIKLSGYGLGDRVAALNRELVAISRSAAGEGLVAGNLSSAGKFLKPAGELSFEELFENFAEQAGALEEAGVDFFAAETLMGMAEVRAAILAVREKSRKPLFVTVSCDAGGRTLTGGDIAAILVTAQSMGAVDGKPSIAFGLNCSSGPEEMLENMKRLSPFARIPLIAKPNAGLPAETGDGRAVYSMTPEEFVRHTQDFADLGVRIFGGCCGTDDSHIAALAAAVRKADFGAAVNRDSADEALCTSERGTYRLAGASEAVTLVASPGLDDRLYDLERDAPAVKIEIDDEEGLSFFEDCCMLINTAFCPVCPTRELFERALRIYNGRAFYDPAMGFDKTFLTEMSQKYGLIG